MSIAFCDKPLAAEGYTSYRYKGRFGWIMIGAHDTDDALREARRSTDDPVTVAGLQIWNGNEYTEVTA
jgi:hypothetical protein